MSALRSRLFAPSGPDRGPEHGIVVLIGALLLFEASLYSAVTPVLPHYAHTLHASKPAIGVLAAAYPAGMLPGSLIGAWIAARAGVRRTVLVGLLLFAVSIAAFGFGSDIVTLDGLRFVQGAACGCIWGGGLTWVIAVSPRERRGEVLGSVIASAIFGTLLGPVLGTLAVALGTQIVFSFVGAVSLALAVWTLDHPEPPKPEPGTRTPLRALARSPRIMLGFWLILLEACTLGATGTLLPLRLSRFGASGVAIGATFLVASLLSTIIAPSIGRLVDRRGAGLPLCLGLTIAAALLATLPLAQSALALAVITVITLGGPLTAYTIPAMSVITESAERSGIALVVATMVLNLAWATGETIGAPAAASISQATSDAVPLLLLAAIMVVTLGPVLKARLTAPATSAPTAEPAGRESAGASPESERVTVGSR
ncbi:MAG: MFS transporter [Solirubrobacteraceae bacterium]